MRHADAGIVHKTRMAGEQLQEELNDAGNNYLYAALTLRSEPPMCHNSHHSLSPAVLSGLKEQSRTNSIMKTTYDGKKNIPRS